jgi:hypothetical protein
MKQGYLFIFFALLLSSACQPATDSGTSEKTAVTVENPAADGFNQEASDEKAIAIADAVMEAMGGRKSWDQTRYIGWTFFGRRHLLWDKKTGNVRISMDNDSTVYQVNVFDQTGRVKQDGMEQTEPDSIAKYLERAKSIWINDSYWLVMPFKLKDSGVTLKYVGQDTTLEGKAAEVLQLTFEEVGNTPQNKYLVYVDTESNLVTQWDFYRNATDAEPGFQTPWKDYQKYGKIMLSGDRGRAKLSDIAVYQSVPDSVFQVLGPIGQLQ